MKKPVFRRIIAFLIDMVIVSLISSALANISFLNPNIEEYNNAYDEYVEYINEVSKDSDSINKLYDNNDLQDLTYNLNYYGVYDSIIVLVVTFLYFCIFQYYTKGKTAGKLLMGIEVIPTKGKKLKLSQLIIRSAVINSLITNAISILLIIFLSKNNFQKYSIIVEIINVALLFACYILILYREDGMGLHDILAGTKVVRINNDKGDK